MAALGLAFVGQACGNARPTPKAETGPKIVITGASVDGTGHVVASFTLTRNGKGLDADGAGALRPSWTLAGLSVDPATVGLAPDPDSGLVRPPVPAWQSYLLTGAETLQQLPIEGPGTPPQFILQNVKQPGSESGGTLQDLGGGSFTYSFQNALPQGFDPAQTLRVGVWLGGTPGTPDTTSTFDFAPNGGPVQARELVLDANCFRCHGTLGAHGGFRTGTKICLTCHTYQNADADTVDPAALTGATPATNPNPLDMGRLVHRIHRGKNLPTLYLAAAAIPNPPARANIALPFGPGRNAPRLGQKFSFVGFQSRETIYGRVVNRIDNAQPPRVVATGVGFPQDLRNCDACHGGAAQAAERFPAISRRTCQGCHPDTWFGGDPNNPPTTNPDQVHFLHPCGPQVDDHACYGCHYPTATVPNVDADITALHVAPSNSPSYNVLTASIVSVTNLAPGQSPTVVFTLTDRDGTPSPLNNPVPAMDPTSPVPRALRAPLGRVAITVSGPTAFDYLTGNFASTATAPITETVPLATAADASGQFSYTFKATIPADAGGTWAVALEARRQFDTPFYDAGTDTFFWPFTGERLTEWANNPVQYVDVAMAATPGGTPVPRRQVVDPNACNACHMQLSLHGGLRHNVEYCVMCHAPDATDWNRRPKLNGNTNLGATFDDVEERSVHFKVMIHRIHTGERTGSAELDLARPFVVYGFGGTPNFFDEVRFPNDLANCTLCHQNGSWAIESVPAGALPTVANETPTIQHRGTAAHGAGETATPPIQAACMGCHDTGAALLHAQANTDAGGEQCALCHGAKGWMAVEKVHHLPPPP